MNFMKFPRYIVECLKIKLFSEINYRLEIWKNYLSYFLYKIFYAYLFENAIHNLFFVNNGIYKHENLIKVVKKNNLFSLKKL